MLTRLGESLGKLVVESRFFKSFMSPSMEELGLFDTARNRIPEASQGNYDAYLKAYADEGWVYACVSRRALDLATAPIYLVSKKDKKKVEEHAVLDLLAAPNPAMDRFSFLEQYETSLLITGNLYWFLDEYKAGMPTKIWPLVPSLVKIIPDEEKGKYIKAFEYSVNGKKLVYTPEFLKHQKLMNPRDMFYGLAPLSAARMSADTHRASSRWNLRFFDKGARPDFVVELPSALDPATRKRAEEKLRTQYQGEENAHGTMFLAKGASAKILNVSQKDMDFLGQKKMSREEICSVYRVPPCLVGLFEYANYATAEEQEKMYFRSTVLPDAERFVHFLNANILPLFDRGSALMFMVDKSELPALQEDEVQRSQYVDRYWRMGVPLNQLVKAYKLPFGEVAGDSTYSAPVPLGADVEEDESEDVSEEPDTSVEKDEEKRAKRAPSSDWMSDKRRRFDAMAERLSPGYRSEVRKFLDAQRDALVAKARSAKDADELRAIARRVTDNDGKLAEIILEHCREAVNLSYAEEHSAVSRLVGRASAPETQRKNPARIEKWLSRNALRWARDINDTTLDGLDSVIERGLAEGLGVEEISRELADSLDMKRDFRTDRVVQTEVIAALNEGALESYRDNEMVESKAWLATDDPSTRESHRRAGETQGPNNPIPLDEEFEVGDASGMSPGQTGDPSEDCNCRCTIVPIVRQ